MVKRVSMLVISLLLAASASHAQSAVPPDTVITLQREADAFGNGGFYELTIAADGTVALTRFRNPTREYNPNEPDKQIIHARVTIDKLAELVAEADRLKYFSLNDTYTKTSDGCPGVIIDQGGAATSIKLNGKTKSIAHYYGCRKSLFDAIYPEQLTAFERKIDEIVATKELLKQ